MSLKAMILLAPGFEDLEAVTVIDLLRRAKFQVAVISLREDEVTGTRGTEVITDGNIALLDKQSIVRSYCAARRATRYRQSCCRPSRDHAA